MTKSILAKKILYWTPRVLTILYITFISIFALDVFGEYGFPEVLVALFMHLVTTFILIIILIIAWKRELIGGVILMALGILFTIFFKTYEELINFLLISLPVFLVGGLFLLNHYQNSKNHAQSQK